MIELKDNKGYVKARLLLEDESTLNLTGNIISVPLNEGSVHHSELMASNYIKLRFSLYEPIRLERGCHVEYRGEKYFLCDGYYPTYNEATDGYDYDVKLDAWYYAWNKYILKLSPNTAANETAFDYTARLSSHLSLVRTMFYYLEEDSAIIAPSRYVIHGYSVDTDNSGVTTYREVTTTMGSGILDTPRNSQGGYIESVTNLVKDEATLVSYSGHHITDALSAMAEAFGCEWWFEGTELHFGRCEKASSHTWENAETAIITRSESSDEYATRVYAYGSTTNVPSRYRKKLLLECTEKKRIGVPYSLWVDTVEASDYIREKGNSLNDMGRTAPFAGYDASVGSWDMRFLRMSKPQTIAQTTLPWDGDYTISASIAVSLGMELTEASATLEGSYLSSKSISASVASQENGSGIITISGKFHASSPTEVRLNLSVGALILGVVNILPEERANWYVDGYLTINPSAIRLVCSREEEKKLAFRDSFRRMYPSFFRAIQPVSTEKSYSFAPIVDSPLKGSDYVLKDGNKQLIDLGYYNYGGKVTIKPNFIARAQLLEGGTFDVTIEATLIGKTEVVSLGEIFSGKVTAEQSGTSMLPIVFDKPEDVILREGGTLRLAISWNVSNPNIYGSIEIGVSFSFTCNQLNYMAETTIKMTDSEGKNVFDTFPAVVNIFGAKDGTEDSAWFFIDDAYSSRIDEGDHFMLTNVNEYKTDLPYFTDDYNTDSTIAGFNRRLMLPIDICPQNYVEKSNITTSEVVEAQVIFDDIYPSRELLVEAVEPFWVEDIVKDESGKEYPVEKVHYRFFIKESDFPFKFEYITPKATLSVVFMSGKLAGMTFELNFEDSFKRTINGVDYLYYEIVKKTEGNIDLPNEALKPVARDVDSYGNLRYEGDRIVFINYDTSAVGDVLVPEAENRLYRAAMDYLKKVSEDCGTYTSTLYSDFAKSLYEGNGYPTIGSSVLLKKKGLFDDKGRTSRILSLEYKLDIPYDSPQFTLGESAAYSRLRDLENKLETSAASYAAGGAGNAYGEGLTEAQIEAAVEKAANKRFLSKVKNDTAGGSIAFEKNIIVKKEARLNDTIFGEFTRNEDGRYDRGAKITKEGSASVMELEIGNYSSEPKSLGAKGNGLKIDRSGEMLTGDYISGLLGAGMKLGRYSGTEDSYLEIDRLLVRKIAYFAELMIERVKHAGGQIMLTPASMICSKVEMYDEKGNVTTDKYRCVYYRCYFEKYDGTKAIYNEFEVGDQARCQTFNIEAGTYKDVSNQYYWRKVVNVGDDFIDLSASDCDLGSLAPKEGDHIIQLGHESDPERQNAILLSAYGENTPSITKYAGIDSYSLRNKEVTFDGFDANTKRALFKVFGDFYFGDRDETNYVKYSQENGLEILANAINLATKDGDVTNLRDMLDKLGVDLDRVKEQTDQQYVIWFEDHEPTNDNYPANEWTTPELRAEHDQDIFYYREQGRAWRYVEGEWVEITDAETLRALELIKEKKRVFTGGEGMHPNPPYDEGDLWTNAYWFADGEDGVPRFDEAGNPLDPEYLYMGDLLICVNPKKKGEEFDIDDWEPALFMTHADIEIRFNEIYAYVKSEDERLESSLKLLIEDGVASATLLAQNASDVASNAAQLALTASEDAASAKLTAEHASETATNAAGLALQASEDAASAKLYVQSGDLEAAIKVSITNDRSFIQLVADEVDIDAKVVLDNMKSNYYVWIEEDLITVGYRQGGHSVYSSYTEVQAGGVFIYNLGDTLEMSGKGLTFYSTFNQGEVNINKDDVTIQGISVLGSITSLEQRVTALEQNGGGGGGASVMELSEAAYNALSSSEKNNGTLYAII